VHQPHFQLAACNAHTFSCHQCLLHPPPFSSFCLALPLCMCAATQSFPFCFNFKHPHTHTPTRPHQHPNTHSPFPVTSSRCWSSHSLFASRTYINASSSLCLCWTCQIAARTAHYLYLLHPSPFSSFCLALPLCMCAATQSFPFCFNLLQAPTHPHAHTPTPTPKHTLAISCHLLALLVLSFSFCLSHLHQLFFLLMFVLDFSNSCTDRALCFPFSFAQF
jgi:hypothetical protein